MSCLKRKVAVKKDLEDAQLSKTPIGNRFRKIQVPESLVIERDKLVLEFTQGDSQTYFWISNSNEI